MSTFWNEFLQNYEPKEINSFTQKKCVNIKSSRSKSLKIKKYMYKTKVSIKYKAAANIISLIVICVLVCNYNFHMHINIINKGNWRDFILDLKSHSSANIVHRIFIHGNYIDVHIVC